MLGGHAAYAAELLAPALTCRPARRHGAHVVFGDAPTGPGSRDRREVDSQVTGDATDDRCGLRSSGCRRTRDRPSALREAAAWLLRPRARDCLAGLADDHELGSHRSDLSFGDEDAEDRPLVRRRDLDRGLVRLNLDERFVLAHLLTFSHEPARDLALGEALAEIRELERVRHRLRVILVDRPTPEPSPLADGDDHPERRQGDQQRRCEESDGREVLDARAVITTVDESVGVVVTGDDCREGRHPDQAREDQQADSGCTQTSLTPGGHKSSAHEREQRNDPDLNPGGGHGQAARTRRTASTTRASDGTYASSICQ